MKPRKVVVTGRGIVSPLGVGIAAHADALVAGRSVVRAVDRLAALGLSSSRGAAITSELLAPYLGRLNRKQQKLYNRPTLLAMIAAALSMEDARLAPGAGDPARLGVVLGVNVLSWDLDGLTEFLRASESRAQPGALDMPTANAYCMRNINPLDYSLKTLPNLAAAHVAIGCDAQGACRSLTEGAVGGADAIGHAYRMVAENDLDVALAGGSDALLEPLVYVTLGGAGLYASDDGSWPGPVVGEGSGIVVLEEADHARARGAPARVEILGCRSAAGSGRLPHEDDAESLGNRLARVIAQAVDDAGHRPDVVCLHGDGAPSHEIAEDMALTRVWGLRRNGVRTLRMKPAHGDLGAASGAVELMECAAVLGDGERGLLVSLGAFGECTALVLGGRGLADAA